MNMRTVWFSILLVFITDRDIHPQTAVKKVRMGIQSTNSATYPDSKPAARTFVSGTWKLKLVTFVRLERFYYNDWNYYLNLPKEGLLDVLAI